MKTFILATLSLIAVSCTERPDMPDYNYDQSQYLDCGTVVQSGEEAGNDFILVKMGSESANNYDKYLVANYQDYKLGSKICNFAGMQKVAF